MSMKVWVATAGWMLVTVAVFAQEANEFDVTIEEEQNKIIDRGGKGAYGSVLSKLANFVSLNGFADNELHVTEDEVSFDQHEVNLFVSAEFSSQLTSEFNIDFKESGEEIEVEYAFLDYEFNRSLIIRGGKFLLPTSDFNEYSWLPYVNRMVEAPLSIVASPNEWSSVGLQLRGKLGAENAKVTPFYAAYIVNGLGQPMEIEDEEDEIFSVLNGLSEAGEGEDNNKFKDFGAQFGVEFGDGFSLSTYYHYSRYDSSADLAAGIYGVSAGFDNGKLHVSGEYHNSSYDKREEDTPSVIEEGEVSGYFLLGAYKINDRWEPGLRLDGATIEGEDITRYTLGLNYYFGTTRLLKFNVGQWSHEDEEEAFMELGLVFSF